MAQLDLYPENCPSCGINIAGYLKDKEKEFEIAYAGDLGRIREKARREGITRGVFYGWFFGTFLLLLSWDLRSQKSLVEQIMVMFSQHPLMVSLGYFLSIATFILLNAVGKVHSRKEQEMWEGFLRTHSTQGYLQPIE